MAAERGTVLRAAERTGEYLVRLDGGREVTAAMPVVPLEGGPWVLHPGTKVLVGFTIVMIGPGGTDTVEGVT